MGYNDPQGNPFNPTGNYEKNPSGYDSQGNQGGISTRGGGRTEDNPGWYTGDTARYSVDPANYAHREGIPDWYAAQVEAARQNPNANAANIDAARGLQASGRGGMLGALQSMRNRPLESQAMGEAMMRQGQQQVAGNLAAQMASAPGRFNPATMRQAQMGMASAGQNMALQAQQQGMAAAMAERQARDQAAIQGYGQLDQNDIQRLMAEQRQRAADQDFWGKQQAAQQGWSAQGLQEKSMEAAARRAYEQAKMAGYFGQPVQGQDATGQTVGTISSIAGSLAALSDVRAKQNIRPATSEARTLLEAMKRGF